MSVDKKLKYIVLKKRIMRSVSSAFRIFIRIILKIPKVCGKICGDKSFSCNLLIPMAQAVQAESDCYVTYNLYPKYANDQNDWLYAKSVFADEWGIVMQGPLRGEEEFTLETVRYYAKLYPGVRVIVSTWKGEDEKLIEKLSDEKNCYIIQSDLPKEAGISNINYQSFSSMVGVRRAKELGIRYVLKTRTDSRVNMPGLFDWLQSCLKMYPLDQCEGQKERLILFNAYLFMPFQEFGMFYAGNVDDMLSFFNTRPYPHVEKIESLGNFLLAQGTTYRQAFKEKNALNYLTTQYFAKVGESVECDMQQWWNIVAKRTICLSVAMLKPLWPKYDYNHEESDMCWIYRRKIMGQTGIDQTMIDFAWWHKIREGKEMPLCEEYEYLLDIPMT